MSLLLNDSCSAREIARQEAAVEAEYATHDCVVCGADTPADSSLCDVCMEDARADMEEQYD